MQNMGFVVSAVGVGIAFLRLLWGSVIGCKQFFV